MKAVVFTLGCKVNRYESDYILQELTSNGFEVSDELIPADVYILNTCAVTAEAERKSRQAVTRCLKCNPNAKVFVIGCASQKEPLSFKKDNVVYIGGTGAKYKVLSHIFDKESKINDNILPNECENTFLYTPSRTRSFVKIQDGCNNFCSYCIIPYLRGRSRSRNIDEIVKEVEALSEKTPEIVLTGINTMAYGSDIGTTLPRLIRELKDFDVRIRMSSFYAEGITEELLDDFFRLKHFCPHFHLSLQSGDADVLKAMNRHYTPEVYANKIELIRSYDPNATITTDIIVGFPTETEQNYLNTEKFCSSVRFSDLHIFPFSAREGTVAAKFKKLPSSVVVEREKRLFKIKKELRNEHFKRNIGLKHKVLIEQKVGEYYVGYSENYTKIYTKQEGGIVEIIPQCQFKDGLK